MVCAQKGSISDVFKLTTHLSYICTQRCTPEVSENVQALDQILANLWTCTVECRSSFKRQMALEKSRQITAINIIC